MKIHYLFFLLLTLGCNPAKRLANVHGEDIFQRWTHSYEEDKDGFRVYRPAGFAFPPARGREGFEIRADGVYIRHAIGRADAPEQMQGSWKMKGKDKLIVTVPESTPPIFEMTILSVTKDQLKIQE